MRCAVNEEDRFRCQKYLADLLGSQHGIFHKLGQWLSQTGSENDPLQDLGDNAQALDQSIVLELIEHSFGRPWQEFFSSFNKRGLAASLGQVHRAKLKDGTDVAVKVQYPGIREQLAGELRFLGLMPGIGPVKKWGIDLDGYRKQLQKTINEELDYRGETDRQQIYQDALCNDEGVLVPGVICDLCSDRVICQEWLEGSTLAEASAWDIHLRKQVAEVLIRHFCRQLFERHTVHCDPHDGNYRFWFDGINVHVILYDFGCLCTVTEDQTFAVMRLIHGLRFHDNVDPVACLQVMGYDIDKLQPIRSRLPSVVQQIFLPFIQSGICSMQEWHPGEKIRAILGDQNWWFRSAGRPDHFLIMRAYAGLIRQIRALNVNVSWSSIYESVAGHLIPDALSVQLPQIDGEPVPCSSLSDALFVRVTEQGVEKVFLKMPALAVNNISDLLDESIVENIRSRGISLDSIIDRCRSNAYQPQVLFEETINDKLVKVWLE